MISGVLWRRNLAVILSVLLGFVLLGGGASASDFDQDGTQNSHPSSSALKTWPFAQKGAFDLRDGWTVYRGQILAPSQILTDSCALISPLANEKGEAVSVPDMWGPRLTLSVTSGHGSATYCRAIELPDDNNFYALRMGTLRSVFHIYALYYDEDGQRQVVPLQQNGALDVQAEQMVSKPAVPVISLPFGVSKFTLLVQLSNRIHKQGGMAQTPQIDLGWRMAAAENRATAIPSALVICLLLIAASAFALGQRSEDATDHFLFAFLASAAALRAAFVSDLIWDYFPAFDLARKYDLEYLSLFLIAVAYYGFVNRLLRPGKILKIDYAIYGFTGALIFFAIFLAPFFPPGTITLSREPIQIVWFSIVLMVIYMVFHTGVKVPERRQEAIVVSLAAALYAGYEILSATGGISYSLEWSQFVIFIVVLMHAHTFVIKAARTEKERDLLLSRLQDTNQDLENRAFALDVALKRAEAASTAKSNFLATFSHELRTPLNAIIGFSELMARELFGPMGSQHYKSYVSDINASGRHLLTLVDDILDLSRIEAGDDKLKECELDVCKLVEDTFSLLGVQAQQKKVKVRLDRDTDVPKLIADERKFRQILINLVANAIKFNRKHGSVVVKVHADETGLYIDVTDTGVGIAEEDIPLVLSRFGQAESDIRPKDTGVGIGLPLSVVLLNQHGGKLKVSSVLGEGTCICLWLPPERLCREMGVA